MKIYSLLFFGVGLALIAGCATQTLPPKPPGFATLWGDQAKSVGSLFDKNSGNVFIVEVDGDAKDGSLGMPVYLAAGSHRIAFWAASGYRRSEIIRFDFDAKADAGYLIDFVAGRDVMEIALVEDAEGKKTELKRWKLPTVYHKGQGAVIPIFIPG
jgi:hypothetical protein